MINRFHSDLDFLKFFYEEEIRNSINVIEYYLSFLSDNKRTEISGDSLYIEKRNQILVFGNLFDDEFPEVSMKSDVFVDFLEQKKQTLK